MNFDLIIRGGTVVDGGNTPANIADVAVLGDTIVEIGNVSGTATREIDASGLVVTPGFIDMHTHLDAQISWDPYMTPLTGHGVTTALLGNCGVTFAPCKADDRETLAAMMETVEDIPKRAILEGLSWEWESYGEYLNALEKLQPAVNVAGLVGHCALRYYVMGARGVDEQPNAAELEQMAEIVEQSIKDGAIGFSTSRLLMHYLPDGRNIPGTHAEHHEIIEIAKRVAAQGGLMQNVMNFHTALDSELELLRNEARTGSRVLFSAGARESRQFSDQLITSLNDYRNEGLDIHACAIPRSGGYLSNLHSTFIMDLLSQFMAHSPGWQRLFELPFAERLASLTDDNLVNDLVAEAEAYNKQTNGELDREYQRFFWLGDGPRPDYSKDAVSLLDLAAQTGIDPARQWLNMMRESEGRTTFNYHLFNPSLEHLEDVVTTDWCMPGLGDAGAHVGQVMDCGWATFTLSYWHRDRGVYGLEEAVRRITSIPAHVLGLTDRGTLTVGSKADINIIDIERLSERHPEFVYDFPNDSGRFVQHATGYRATICNGQIVVEDDELTGNRAGSVLRSSQPGNSS
jgi:N-acyl-D-amino-acid deacylase|tara:strand:- start:54192 stop:55907 length:1716 start_codon:yes stop_codon:yes gene_type:complete